LEVSSAKNTKKYDGVKVAKRMSKRESFVEVRSGVEVEGREREVELQNFVNWVLWRVNLAEWDRE
jgi:hypothetical protein